MSFRGPVCLLSSSLSDVRSLVEMGVWRVGVGGGVDLVMGEGMRSGGMPSGWKVVWRGR